MRRSDSLNKNSTLYIAASFRLLFDALRPCPVSPKIASTSAIFDENVMMDLLLSCYIFSVKTVMKPMIVIGTLLRGKKNCV